MGKVLEFKRKKKMSEEDVRKLVQDNLDKMSRDEVEKILVEDFNSIFSNFKEFTCVWSFFNFLVDEHKKKSLLPQKILWSVSTRPILRSSMGLKLFS